ncbi:aromatic motif membrane protein [Mycoplasma sp. 1654_15]|uniref:aromatic motif membrane protein n=1 Tax=Mycoplasma sp. 1654_15 TaxID=2725994 RepID=UPI001449B1A6|nr:aromatic motif membrane protein [Mycoplasma sp. 1654_15]QJB70942.1 hypothetical protein HF996_00155 [Mycoplasma sp. 1654_15]
MKVNKKYFSVLFLPLFSSLLLSSCSEVSTFYTSSPTVQKKDSNSIEQLLNNIYIDKQDQKQTYIFQQNTLDKNKQLEELKYSFSLYNPSLFKINTKISPNLDFLAKQTIYNNFSNNWLFILRNIKNFEFAFNPYSFSYSPYSGEKEDFGNQEDKFLKIKNENFSFIKKEIVTENNYWTEQNIYYLIFDKNKILRLWTFERNQQIFARFDFDLFIYKDNPNFIISFIDDIHNEILSYSTETQSEEISNILSDLRKSEEQEIKTVLDTNKQSEKKDSNTDQNVEEQIKNIQSSYNQTIDKVTQQINKKYLENKITQEESKYNILKNNYYFSLNQKINNLNNKWHFEKFSFRNIDSETLQISKNQEEKNNNNEEKWSKFLNNDAILNLLNIVFNNLAEKESYINSQKFLDSKIYSKLIKSYLFYYNHLNTNPDGNPYAYLVSQEKIKNLFSKNWLWFLFYLNKAYFMRTINPIDSVDSQLDELQKDNSESSGFYSPTSNVFSDLVYKKVEDNFDKPLSQTKEYFKKYSILLQNEDKFVFSIEVIHTYNNLKNKIKNTIVTLSPYIFIVNTTNDSEQNNLNLNDLAKLIFAGSTNNVKKFNLTKKNIKFFKNLTFKSHLFIFSDFFYKNKEK